MEEMEKKITTSFKSCPIQIQTNSLQTLTMCLWVTLCSSDPDMCVCMWCVWSAQCVMCEICTEITHQIFSPCWVLLIATFLEPRAHWLNGCPTVPLSLCLPQPSSLCVSLCLSPRERDLGWIVRSIVSVRCLLMRAAANRDSRAAIEGTNR